MGISELSGERALNGWMVSVQTDAQVDFLRDAKLDGEDRRRSVMILEKPYRYAVICLAGYGPDGNPHLAKGVTLGRAVKLAQAEMRAVEAGHPTSVPVDEQEPDEKSEDAGDDGEGDDAEDHDVDEDSDESGDVDGVDEDPDGQASINQFF